MELILAMAPQGGEAGGSANLISTLVMFGAIFAIFYFMIIRPQQKRAKERDQLLSALEKGDKVVLNSGMHGTIAGLDDKTCLIDAGNGIKLKFERAAIASVIKNKE